LTTDNSQELNKKNFQIALGNRIRQLREEKNISQTELGNLCNIERSNMNRIEAGNTNPTAFTLYKIAQNLGVALSKITDVVE
jgi:transcriptional regulator with XRE-family HTH domain